MPTKKTEVKQRRAGKQLQIQTGGQCKGDQLRGAEASCSYDDLEAF